MRRRVTLRGGMVVVGIDPDPSDGQVGNPARLEDGAHSGSEDWVLRTGFPSVIAADGGEMGRVLVTAMDDVVWRWRTVRPDELS